MEFPCVVPTLGSGGHKLEAERRPLQAGVPSAGHSLRFTAASGGRNRVTTVGECGLFFSC